MRARADKGRVRPEDWNYGGFIEKPSGLVLAPWAARNAKCVACLAGYTKTSPNQNRCPSCQKKRTASLMAKAQERLKRKRKLARCAKLSAHS